MTRNAPFFPGLLTPALLVFGGGDELKPALIPAPSGFAPVATRDSAGHQKMLGVLEYVARTAADDNRFVGYYELHRLRYALESVTPETPITEHLTNVIKYASSLLRLGMIDETITTLQDGRKLLKQLSDPSAGAAELNYRLGIAWLRKAERENCVECTGGESCTYPLTPAGVHKKTEGSRNAIRCFLDTMAYTQPNSMLHLRARWLLNICHMTLGTYPDGVQPQHRIDPSLIAGTPVDFPAFENIAPTVGVDVFELAGGMIVDDFTDDGIFDVFTATSDCMGPSHFFRGTAEGIFVDETEKMGLKGIQAGGLHVSRADYDNDGDIDVWIPRGAWLQENGRHPASLLQNNGADGFTDVTFDAGLGTADYPSQVGVWADYDRDGDLDLFSGSEANADHLYPCHLFRNNADGTFTDVAGEAGLMNGLYTKGANWGDYNNDRWPDLYVSNLGAKNRLYRNNGDGTFDDVAEELEVTLPMRSFSCWFWDFNNDGNLDIFVASYDEDVAEFVASWLKLPTTAEPAALYKGDGKGGFVNVAESHGLAHPLVTMGSGFGDLDNDGYLDMYLGTGFPSYEGLVPNLTFHNMGGERFQNISMASRMGNLQKGHAIAFADIDRDGDQDIYARLGGALRDDGFAASLFRNPGFGNNWFSVKLLGVQTNRLAVGARVRARFTDEGKTRDVYRWIGQSSSFGNNPFEEHIGVGKATKVEELEIYWPTSDTTQMFRDLDVTRRYEITEGSDEVRTWPIPVIAQPQVER